MINYRLKLKLLRENVVLDILMMSLLIVPFISLIDIVWYFADHSFNEWHSVKTPFIIKFLKDVLLIFLMFFLIFLKKPSRTNILILVALIGIIVYQFLTSIVNNTPILIFISGLRWFLPVFLFPLFDDFLINKEELKLLITRYKTIVYVSLVFEIFQIFFSTRWNDIQNTDYLTSITSSRANGIFTQPQPMALFTLFFIIIFFSLNVINKNKFVLFVSFISIVLTKSAAGILGLFSFLFFKMDAKIKPLILIVGAVALLTFPKISGRATFWDSPVTRFKIFSNINFNEPSFGSYTNTCHNIIKFSNSHNIHCKIPDSFLVSLFGNLGIFTSFLIIGIILFYIFKSKKYYILPIFLILSVSSSFTEFFIINIFFPFYVGMKAFDPLKG